MSLNVIELLERDAARATDKIAAGVLLGRAHHGRELTLIVEHYESATPERGATESPFANPQAVETMLDRWRPGRSRMSVLGFYRSSAEEAVLNATDLSAVQATLSNTGSKGTNPAPSTDTVQKAAETPAPTVSGIQDPERIFLLIEPRAGLSTACLYLARKGVVVCQSPRIPFNRAELAKTGTSTESQSSEQYRPPAYAAKETSVSREGKPPAPRDRASAKFMPWLKRYQWVFFGLSALPLMIAVFVSSRYNQAAAPHASAAQVAPSDSVLGLKLDRSGSAWKLSWDADSPAVRDATDGHLLITDGALHRDLELASADLRGGTIIYTPMTDDVVLQLQLDTPGGSEPLSASVRTLGGGVSSVSATSMPSPGIPPNLPPGIPALVTANVPPLDESALRESVARSVPPAVAVPAPQKAAAPVLKSEKALAAALSPMKMVHTNPDTARTLAEPVSRTKTVSVAAADPSPRPRTITQYPAPTPQADPVTVPTWPASPAPTTSPAVPEKSTNQSNAIEVARLVSRDDPVYPETAKQLALAGTVEVHFKIGKDSQVRDVNVVNGFDALGQAAIEAVQKWRYSPAKIDGVPTESEASAVFVFKKS